MAISGTMDGDAIRSIFASLPNFEGVDIEEGFQTLKVSTSRCRHQEAGIFQTFAELPGGKIQEDDTIIDVDKQPAIREVKVQSIWVGAGPKFTDRLTRRRFMSMVRANIGKRPGGNFEDSVLY